MTARAMRQATVDRFALPPADLPTIRTCRGCGYLRYVEFACFGCACALEELPPQIAPEPLRTPPPKIPERRPPGREVCDPLPLRRQAWRKAAG
jgi:hypothetical protein